MNPPVRCRLFGSSVCRRWHRPLANLPGKKASGLSGVPAEALRAAPVSAAHCFSSLLLKMQIRGQTPALWCGGKAVAIEKPSKPLGQLSSWRSILLLEAGAKGVAHAIRPCLLKSFEALRCEGQGGSRPGSPIQVLMAVCRGFLRRLRRDRLSGGVVFVDGASAFYSVLRQRLCGSEGQHSTRDLEELAVSIFDEEEDRIRFLAGALGPGLLANTGTPEPVRRLIVSSFEASWFSIGDAEPRTYLTRTGSIPGAPLADLAFQMSFSMALRGLQKRMVEAGCNAQLRAQDAGASFQVPAPSWMDDLAVPLVVAEATSVVPSAASIVEAVAAELHEMGVAINLSRGKTELLPVFSGVSQRKEKLRWICHETASFPVRLPGAKESLMHIVPTYVHLGAVVAATAGDLEDIARRRSLARDMLRSQLKLLRNPHLSHTEKVKLLLSVTVARFQHGSGLWELGFPAERRAYHSGYMEILRRACRPITGLSCRGMTDSEVCSCIGVLSSEEARTVQLCRHAAWLQSEPCEAIQELWFRSGDWFRESQVAIQACAVATGCSAATACRRLRDEPHLARIWTKAFSRACLRARKELQDALLVQWRNYEKAALAGWIFLRHDVSVDAVPAFPCSLCRFSARSLAALASHQRAVHGVAARAAIAATGSKCEVCCKEFWTTKRLKLHLRKHEACLAAAEGADLDSGPDIHGAHSFAWPPAMPVYGPKPFWATLTPSSAPLPVIGPAIQDLPWPTCSRANKRSSTPDLAAFAKALLHFAVRVRPEDDDVPIALLDKSFGVADVTRCVLAAARPLLARSAGGSTIGNWRCCVSGDRVVILPVQADRVEPLPAVWQVCMDSP